MAEIRLHELKAQIGLPDLALDQTELKADFMPACVAGLADGDLAVLHPPYLDHEKARLYGATLYNDGEVASKVVGTALRNGLQQTPIYYFQSFAAEYYETLKDTLNQPPAQSATRIYPETLVVDGNPLALPRPPRLVVDYAACLTSRSIIADQLDGLQRTGNTFTYAPITRLHFTNRVLMQTYDSLLGDGASRMVIRKGYYVGREDGIASATDEMIRAQLAAGAPADMADIITYKGGEHTTPEDTRRGMQNAYTILREAGMLVIRSFAKPAADEMGADQIASWAYEAGFEEGTSMEYQAVNHNLGAMVLKGAAPSRLMKTVVLTK